MALMPAANGRRAGVLHVTAVPPASLPGELNGFALRAQGSGLAGRGARIHQANAEVVSTAGHPSMASFQPALLLENRYAQQNAAASGRQIRATV